MKRQTRDPDRAKANDGRDAWAHPGGSSGAIRDFRATPPPGRRQCPLRVKRGQERRFQSLTGALFTGKAPEETHAGRFPAVIAEMGGKAHYTGRATFTLEEDDEIGRGSC